MPTKKTPVLGIASLTLALLTLLLLGVFIVYALNFGGQGEAARIISWIFVLSILASGLGGIGLGIAAVLQKNTSKAFGILGLALSSLILVGGCAFVLFVLGAAAFFLATL
jgi:hypothetical protein